MPRVAIEVEISSCAPSVWARDNMAAAEGSEEALGMDMDGYCCWCWCKASRALSRGGVRT
jgi:hypothetical protein